MEIKLRIQYDDQPNDAWKNTSQIRNIDRLY